MPKERTAKREEVYLVLDGERDYQDHMGPDRTDGVSRSVGDYLTMLAHYLTKAQAAWTENPGDLPALEVVRKLGGIAVHCMEDHVAMPRVMPFYDVKDSSKS